MSDTGRRFLQIGNPFFYNYDSVCFDCKSPRIEKRIVQLDHEAILQHAEMKVVKEVAPSFVWSLDSLRARRRAHRNIRDSKAIIGAVCASS